MKPLQNISQNEFYTDNKTEQHPKQLYRDHNQMASSVSKLADYKNLSAGFGINMEITLKVRS